MTPAVFLLLLALVLGMASPAPAVLTAPTPGRSLGVAPALVKELDNYKAAYNSIAGKYKGDWRRWTPPAGGKQRSEALKTFRADFEAAGSMLELLSLRLTVAHSTSKKKGANLDSAISLLKHQMSMDATAMRALAELLGARLTSAGIELDTDALDNAVPAPGAVGGGDDDEPPEPKLTVPKFNKERTEIEGSDTGVDGPPPEEKPKYQEYNELDPDSPQACPRGRSCAVSGRPGKKGKGHVAVQEISVNEDGEVEGKTTGYKLPPKKKKPSSD